MSILQIDQTYYIDLLSYFDEIINETDQLNSFITLSLTAALQPAKRLQ